MVGNGGGERAFGPRKWWGADGGERAFGPPKWWGFPTRSPPYGGDYATLGLSYFSLDI